MVFITVLLSFGKTRGVYDRTQGVQGQQVGNDRGNDTGQNGKGRRHIRHYPCVYPRNGAGHVEGVGAGSVGQGCVCG